MSVTVRTMLAVLALIAGSLLATGPASAAAPPHSGHCHSLSSGYKSWFGFETTNLDCGHAHNIARAWSGCGRSSSAHTALHCPITETVGGHPLTFHCANVKVHSDPAYYGVTCTHAHSQVKFTFSPYGF